MQQKNILFSFLVGDMSTYMLVIQLKVENPHQFKDIVSILGEFHQQMLYIYAIYKRFQGSGMADTLVTGGVEAKGSVDHTLKREALSTWPGMYILWREALIHQFLEHQELSENVKLNLDTLHNVLTETQVALDDAHTNRAEDGDMSDLVNNVYKTLGQT